MMVKWKSIFTAVFCFLWAEVRTELDQVIKAIDGCGFSEVEYCLGKHVLVTVKEVSAMPNVKLLNGFLEFKRNTNTTEEKITEAEIDASFQGRSTEEKERGIDSMVMKSIWDFFKTHTVVLRIPEGGRGQGMIRTYRRFRRFFLPLLIGIKLKLAAFLPFALSILGLLATSAFMSGNSALFLSALTIFLRYFYPKSDVTHYKHDTTGHDGHSGGGGDYTHGHYHDYHHHHHPHQHYH